MSRKKTKARKKRIVANQNNISGVIENTEKMLEPEIKLSLELGDLSFKAEGNVFSEVLKKIYDDSFGKVKTWGVITFQKGGKTTQIRMRPIQIKRAFVSRFANDLLEKRFLMMAK